jgi:hypothetical protein
MGEQRETGWKRKGICRLHLDLSGSGYVPLVGYCYQDNENCSSMKDGGFLERMCDSFPYKISAIWSYRLYYYHLLAHAFAKMSLQHLQKFGKYHLLTATINYQLDRKRRRIKSLHDLHIAMHAALPPLPMPALPFHIDDFQISQQDSIYYRSANHVSDIVTQFIRTEG